MLKAEKEQLSAFEALGRGLLLLCTAVAVAVSVAPFVFQITQHIAFLAQYPFRRVFDRVAVVVIVAALLLGWRWLGVRLSLRHLLRRKHAVKRWLTWLIIGFVTVALLIAAQRHAGIRVYKPRDLSYTISKLLSAFGAACIIGFLEEAFFRGYLLQAFLQRIARYKAILVVSIIYAVVHLFSLDHFLKPIKDVQIDGTHMFAGWRLVALFFVPLREPLVVLPGLIGLFLVGWLLAELTVRTRSLWPAIGTHTGLVFAIKFLGRLWKYEPTANAGPAWLYGEKFAATGVLGWLMIVLLIMLVNGFLIYLVYRVVVAGAQLLSHRSIVRLGRALGYLGYYLALRHRHVALENIAAAFPDKSHAECEHIAKESFGTLGMVCMEVLAFDQLAKNFLSVVHPEGLEHIREAMARGKGVVFFTGHLGSWETLSLGCGALGYPFTGVARPFGNEWIYRHVQKSRNKTGVNILDKKNITRDVMQLLHAGRMVGFVGDQYAGSHGLFVTFFGRPASTTPAVALFARKTGAALVPAFDCFMPDGTHKPTIHAPIVVPCTDNYESDVFAATQALMTALEHEVRAHPGMYLWAHRKWRKKSATAPVRS